MKTHASHHALPRMTQVFLAKMHAKKSFIDRATRPQLGDFFRGSIVQWLLFANVLVLAASVAVIASVIRPSGYDVILHYNAFFGVSDEMLGPWTRAYHPVWIGAAVLVINSILAFLAYRGRERIAAYILLLGAFLAQCAILITAVAVALVNRG